MENKSETNNDKCYVVYKHTNLINNKCYIGMTRQNPPKKRWKNGTTYKNNKHFTNAINLYGWNNFSHEILFYGLTKEEAELKEIELIAHYKSNQQEFGYNIANGGNCKGTVSEVTKKKLSDAHMGKKLSPEHIEKIRENGRKRFAVDEFKNKMIELQSIEISQYYNDGTFIRNWKSAAEAERETGICGISSCCTGNRKMAGNYIWRHSNEPLTEEHIAWCNDNRNYGCMIPVCQYDVDGTLLKIYDGQVEAEKETGISSSSINNCCHKICRTAGNYIWRYTNEPLTPEDLEWCIEKRWDKTKKAVVQFSLDFVPIKYFDGISDVRDEYGYDSSTIVKCCKGKKEKAYGYIWRYATDAPDAAEALLNPISPLFPTPTQLQSAM